MYYKNKKHLHHKLAASMLAAAMIFSAAGAPVMAMTNEPATLQTQLAQKSGLNFYDIAKNQKNGVNINDPSSLMKSTLLSQPDGSGKTVLQHWAALACGIFSSTPSSYASEDAEKDMGAGKDLKEFRKRFTEDVSTGTKNYGNLYQLLSTDQERKQSTEDSDFDAKYHQDINTYSTGLRYAQNLNAVQEKAHSLLADLDDSEHVNPSGYAKYHSIPAMAETKEKGTPALYSMVATRDKDGILSDYTYNALGLAFYDFQLEEAPDESGFKKTTPLTAEQVQEIREKIATGKAVDLKGFTFRKEPTVNSHTYEVNDSSSVMTASHSLAKTTSTTVTDTNTAAATYKQGKEFSAGAKVGGKFFSDLFTGELTAGMKLTKEETKTDTKTNTYTTANTEVKTDSNNYPIPAYSAAEIQTNTSTKKITESYSKPVVITYKVAVFSMCGEHQGSSFEDGGCYHRNFFTEIGSQTDNSTAWSNLQDRTAPNHIGDDTYDKSKAVTKLYGRRFAKNPLRSPLLGPFMNIAGYLGLGASKGMNYPWDKPYLDHINWNNAIQCANSLGYDRDQSNAGEDSIKALTTHLPVSTAGGVVTTETTTQDVSLKDMISTRTLSRVDLENANQSSHVIKEGESLRLNSIGLKGINDANCAFTGFNAQKGHWILTDANGTPMKDPVKSDLGTVMKDGSGNPIFKAASGKSGMAYLKYIVNDNVYRVYNQENVKSANVQTPVISVKVQSDAQSFKGSIEIPENINVTYKSNEPIDLNSLVGQDVNVFDAKNHIVNKPVVWVAKNKSGIQMENGKIKITKDGDYQVRAEYGDVASDWMTVHAKASAQSVQKKASAQSDQKKTSAQSDQKKASAQSDQKKASAQSDQKNVPAQSVQKNAPTQSDQKATAEQPEAPESANVEQETAPEDVLKQDASLAQTAAVLMTLNRGSSPAADALSKWFQENVTESAQEKGFEWASQNHIFDGIERTSVSKDDTVTKKEFAVMLYKAYGPKTAAAESTDLTKAALDWASEQGLDVSKADENVKLEEVVSTIAHCVNLDSSSADIK